MPIEPFVVGNAGLPAAVDDPDPFERERTDGGVMTLAPAFLQIVVGPRPIRIQDGTRGELVESLTPRRRRNEPRFPAPGGYFRFYENGLTLFRKTSS